MTKELFQANLKIRVDGEGRSITEPINISQQCIVYRGGRQGCDLIRDEVGLNSIVVSLFGNMTVETREIHMITKEYQNKRSK